MQRSTAFYLSAAIGIVLMLAGGFISSSTWIAFLRDPATTPPDLLPSLLLGATLYRISLAVTGLLILLLGTTSAWRTASRSSAPLPPSKPIHRALLAGILLVALALRLYQLNAGLWHDEITTFVNYGHLSLGELITTYDSQNQHLLYSLLARVSLALFGENAWALRLPAVLFGVASIGALYVLARRVTTVQEALLAGALFAFSYHHIWFSQNARGYTGLLFWTILASWLLVRALQDGSSKTWLQYAAVTALGVYTQLGMLFVVLGHFIIYLLALFKQRREPLRGRWAGLLLGFGVAGILTILLYALILPQFWADFTERTQGATFTTWQNPLWTILEIIRATGLGVAGGAVALAALSVFGLGLWSWRRTNAVMIQLLFIPTIICALVAVGTGHNLWPRLFFFAMGFGVLVAVRGVVVLGTWLGKRLRLPAPAPLRLGVGLGIGMVLLSALTVLFVYGPKQDYEGALSFVEANRRPGDLVVTTGMVAFTYREYYHRDWPDVESVQALETLRAQGQRIWLVYAFRPHMEATRRDVLSAIVHDFQVIEEFEGTLGDGTIFVCRSDASPSVSAGSAGSVFAED